MGCRHQGAQALLDPLGQQARVDIGQSGGADVIAHLHERALPGDDAPIPIERGAGFAQIELLPAALRVFGQALEIVGDLRRPLGPRRRVVRITEGYGTGLEAHQGLDRLTRGGGEAKGRNRASHDLAVGRSETVDRAQAQRRHAREHDDDECRS